MLQHYRVDGCSCSCMFRKSRCSKEESFWSWQASCIGLALENSAGPGQRFEPLPTLLCALTFKCRLYVAWYLSQVSSMLCCRRVDASLYGDEAISIALRTTSVGPQSKFLALPVFHHPIKNCCWLCLASVRGRQSRIGTVPPLL